MKPLHKLGKYHNLDKLKKIANNPCFTVKFPIRHNYVTPLYDMYDDSHTLWGTLGVKWHVDNIEENRKYSIILVIESDKYKIYASAVNDKKNRKTSKSKLQYYL